MNKKIMLVVVIVLCMCAIIGSGTYAYFTSEDHAHNVITTGGVTISIEEWKLENGEMVPYPKDPIEVLPGMDVSKIVTVKNEDDGALVRISYDLVLTDKDGNVIDISEEELQKHIIITPDLESWEVKAEFDGWYYYKSVLESSTTTAPLFEKVSFSPDMGNEFQNTILKVNVHAEAVQAANNAPTAIDAVGWGD